jgi:hypothetical protein
MKEVIPDLASQSQNGFITRRLNSLTHISNIKEQKTLSQPDYRISRMAIFEKLETND